jgi:hypothetical protein
MKLRNLSTGKAQEKYTARPITPVAKLAREQGDNTVLRLAFKVA